MHQATKTKTVKHKHICNIWYSDMFHSVNAMLCCFEWIIRIQTTMYCYPCLYAARLKPSFDVKRQVSDSIHKVKQLPYLIIKCKHAVQDPCISWWASFVLQVFISKTSNIPLTTNQLKNLEMSYYSLHWKRTPNQSHQPRIQWYLPVLIILNTNLLMYNTFNIPQDLPILLNIRSQIR